MDNSVGVLCKTLASFCNHLESSCDALRQSVERRPIPLDSASSTFVQCLNRRVSSTSSDLNLVESMSCGTISFEELLGYCNEVYKKNQNDVSELEDRLRCYGYTPEYEVEDEDEAFDDSCARLSLDLKMVDADHLLADSLSLQDLGLSDVCLATIASKANSKIDSLEISVLELTNCTDEKQCGQYGPASEFLEVIGGEVGDDPESVGVNQSLIKISKDDYEGLPSYMKTLASWENLLAAVEKMNSSLSRLQITKGRVFIHQGELASLGLGKHLEVRRPHLNWIPCAAYCIDLMLEDIFKLPHLKSVFERAIAMNGFIYARTGLLNMMRRFIGQRNMVRHAKTRFAMAFLTLARIHEQKNNLRKMFVLEDWTSSKWAKEQQGKNVARTQREVLSANALTPELLSRRDD